jgi:pyridinium-3,5-bisthiocarboxylic acid mononucleotide nickel chelatase
MLFAETTTLGVRTYTAERRVLARQWETVHTSFGEVRIKVARLNGHIRQASPEFEDCRKLAEARNVPLHRVMDEAIQTWKAKSQ